MLQSYKNNFKLPLINPYIITFKEQICFMQTISKTWISKIQNKNKNN